MMSYPTRNSRIVSRSWVLIGPRIFRYGDSNSAAQHELLHVAWYVPQVSRIGNDVQPY